VQLVGLITVYITTVLTVYCRGKYFIIEDSFFASTRVKFDCNLFTALNDILNKQKLRGLLFKHILGFSLG
jgi:hypothetical protein